MAAQTRRATLRVALPDVLPDGIAPGGVAPGDAGLDAVAEVFFRPDCAPRALLFCLPGGGMHRRYFDLHGFSFADEMTARGALVVTLDYPGTGEATRPADGYGLTAWVLVEAAQVAWTAVRAALAEGRVDAALPATGDLPSIGVGHSMGGMLTILQQHRHAPHAGLALLGFSTAGLPHYLTAAARAHIAAPGWRADTPALARAQFGTAYLDVPRAAAEGEAARALAAAADLVLATPAAHAMVPGNVAAEAAAIDRPVFLAVGERDMTGPPERLPGMFAGSRAVSLHVMAGAGHHPFVAKSAADFYAALADWLATTYPETV